MLSLDGVFLAGPGGGPGLSLPDAALTAGDTWVISGPSGAGKSLILRCLAGTEPPPYGRIHRAKGLRAGIAMGRGGLLANHSLLANLMLPLRYAGVPRELARERSVRALEQLRLSTVADHRPHAVSDRQRKLGSLARVLAWDPDLVLLDEPLELLDPHDLPLVRTLLAAWAQDAEKALVVTTETLDDHAHLSGRRFTLERDCMREL